MSKKILVFGGSGFIGSHLVWKLAQIEGNQVGVFTRTPMKSMLPPRVVPIEGDIRYLVDVYQALEGCDEVYHLAAFHHVGKSWDHQEECVDVNIKGTANIMQSCWNRKIKALYMSTSEVYGIQEETPWHEDMKPNPVSPYGISKYGGELQALMYQKMGADIRVVRPFNVYGPGQTMRAVMSEFILRFLSEQKVHTTKGEQTREFNYVGDIVEGLILAMDKSYEGPINLCSSEEVAIKDLLEMVRKETDSKAEADLSIPYRPNEIMKMVGSNVKAGEVLGWKPKTSLAEGLKTTVQWYRERLGLEVTTSA